MRPGLNLATRGCLTPPGGSPVVHTTAMVARAKYDGALVALDLVHSASRARLLRYA